MTQGTTTTVGSKLRSFIVIAVLLVGFYTLTQVTGDLDRGHLGNGHDRDEDTVVFKAKWRPRSGEPIIEYWINITSKEDVGQGGSWELTKTAPAGSAYQLLVRSTVDISVEWIVCEIWVNNELVAHDRVTGEDDCDI